MYSQKGKSFWNRYNVAWPFRVEPSSDQAVQIAASNTFTSTVSNGRQMNGKFSCNYVCEIGEDGKKVKESRLQALSGQEGSRKLR
jgi:hypothetical protein